MIRRGRTRFARSTPIRLRCVIAVLIPVVVLCFGHVGNADAADPPTIERLFPPGGQRGTTVEAALRGAAGDGTLQVWSDHSALKFAFSEKRDTATIEVSADATPGLHWVRFFNEFGATDPRPFVVGLIPEVAEAEPNNAPDQAQLLEHAATTVNGVLEKNGDVDVYQLHVAEHCTLVASVVARQDLGSPIDAVVELLNKDGVIVAANDDDHGMDPLATVDVAEEGNYFVRVYAFPSEPNSSIRFAGSDSSVYRLTISNGPVVSHTIPAAISQNAASTVTLHGWNLSEATQQVAISATEGSAAMISESLTLPFAVPTSEFPTWSEPDLSSQPLVVPATVTGTISAPGETDAYTFSGSKGTSLTISAAARALNSLLDPVISVTSDDGKELKEADDRSRDDLDAETEFTIPADGTYRVTVSDRYGHGGTRYFYLLTCRETAPSFAATVKATSFVMAAGEALEIPVSLSRDKGFDSPLTVSIEGLPEGILAEPAVSEPKGDSSKSVTLTIRRSENMDVPFQGAFRIRCQRPDQSAAIFTTAPIAGSGHATADLWLTVIGPAGDPEADSHDAP